MARTPQITEQDRRPPRGVPLRPRAPRRWGRRLLAWLVMLVIWGLIALGGMLLWYAYDLPRPEAALDAARRPSMTLQDQQGRIFATFGDVVGDPLRLKDLPPYLPKAFIASLCAAWKSPGSSSGVRTTRMPRPPPPAEAFRITG